MLNAEKQYISSSDRNLSLFLGSGNVVSSARETARWIQLLYTGKAGLSAESVETMVDGRRCDYALGTMVLNHESYGHNGVLDGYFSKAFYNSRLNVTWVLVVNFARWRNDDFSEQLRDLEAFEQSVLELLRD